MVTKEKLYFYFRLKNGGPSNVETGRLINKMKSQQEAKTSTKSNAAVAAGSATLGEIFWKN